MILISMVVQLVLLILSMVLVHFPILTVYLSYLLILQKMHLNLLLPQLLIMLLIRLHVYNLRLSFLLMVVTA